MLNNSSLSIAAKTQSGPRPRGKLPTRQVVRVTAVRKPNASDIKDKFRRGPLDGIGLYLSEAFAQIFSGLDEAESVPWYAVLRNRRTPHTPLTR